MSTRPSGLVPCNNTGVAILHVMNADGSALHPVSVNFVNEFDPAVLPAQAAGEVSRICAELVFGYNAHPSWADEAHKGCFLASELEFYEETMPGIAALAVDVLDADICSLLYVGATRALQRLVVLAERDVARQLRRKVAGPPD